MVSGVYINCFKLIESCVSVICYSYNFPYQKTIQTKNTIIGFPETQASKLSPSFPLQIRIHPIHEPPARKHDHGVKNSCDYSIQLFTKLRAATTATFHSNSKRPPLSLDMPAGPCTRAHPRSRAHPATIISNLKFGGRTLHTPLGWCQCCWCCPTKPHVHHQLANQLAKLDVHADVPFA